MTLLQLNAGEWSAFVLSLQVALCASLLLFVPGLLCGWAFARLDFPGKTLLEALVHLPLVLPPIVTGYVLLVAFGPSGALGGWLAEHLGLRLTFSSAAAVLAAAVVSFPLMVRSVRLAVELIDPRLEDAARTLGSGRLRTFATITLPLALPGLLAGFLLAFARSLGEFGATITLAGNIEGVTQTLPLAIFSRLQMAHGESQAMKLVLLSVALSLGALLIGEWMDRYLRRKWLGGGK